MRSLLVLLVLAALPILLSARDGDGKDELGERIGKRLRLADALEAQGDDEGALKILKEIAEAEGDAAPGIDPAEIHKRIAVILMQSERHREAIPHLRRALAIQGGEEADYGALARLMIDAREFAEAASFLEDAAKRFPGSPGFPFLLTFALAGQEHWQEALVQFDKTLALAEDSFPELIDGYFHFRHAAALERAGNFDEAGALFRKTLDLIKAKGPGNYPPDFTATVLNYLAYMWIERGEHLEESGRMAKEAAGLAPESGPIADTVGWYHFQTGDYPRALVQLKKAERLVETPDPVIYDHLGQTLAKLNERAFAAEYFRKALELDPENADLKARLAEVEP